jgi:hypothetical protein
MGGDPRRDCFQQTQLLIAATGKSPQFDRAGNNRQAKHLLVDKAKFTSGQASDSSARGGFQRGDFHDPETLR